MKLHGLLIVAVLLLGISSCNHKKNNVSGFSGIQLECSQCINFKELDTNKVDCQFNVDSITTYTFRNYYTEAACNSFYINQGKYPEQSIYHDVSFISDTLAVYNDGSDVRFLLHFEIKQDSLILTNKNYNQTICFTFDKTCKGKMQGRNNERFYLVKN